MNLDDLDQQIPIFIDTNLEDGISGIDVARDLHRKGFSNISLASGDALKRSEVPTFIRDLRNKDFPSV